jgi:hypothetical protein
MEQEIIIYERNRKNLNYLNFSRMLIIKTLLFEKGAMKSSKFGKECDF